MFNFNALIEFSCCNCIAICAFLVPAILLSTLGTIVLTALDRAKSYLWLTVGIAGCCGLAMVLHVMIWFMLGVVMAPTFILLYMATTCLIVNIWAIAHPRSLTQLVGQL